MQYFQLQVFSMEQEESFHFFILESIILLLSTVERDNNSIYLAGLSYIFKGKPT